MVKSTLFAFLTISATLVSPESDAKTKPPVLTLKDFPLGVGAQWVYVRTESSSFGFPLEGITKQFIADTVTVKIIGQTKMPNGRVFGIWIREFKSRVDTQQNITLSGVVRPPSKEHPPKVDTCLAHALISPDYFSVDTLYVALIGDTVTFLKRFRVFTDTTKPLQEEEMLRLVFPIKVGNSWNGWAWGTLNPNIRYSVISRDSIKSATNDKHWKAFLVQVVDNSAGNAYGEDKYWIVPGVGVTQKETTSGFSLANEVRSENWKLISYEIRK